MTTLAPLHRTVLVDAGPAEAFRIFTDGIGSWWPLHSHGVFGADATVGFDGGELVEVSSTGERSSWGTVTEWQPGERVALTWHPGKAAEQASDIVVTFVAASDGRTLVTLIHEGWESFADAAAARDGYGRGWPVVLSGYARVAGAVLRPDH